MSKKVTIEEYRNAKQVIARFVEQIQSEHKKLLESMNKVDNLHIINKWYEVQEGDFISFPNGVKRGNKFVVNPGEMCEVLNKYVGGKRHGGDILKGVTTIIITHSYAKKKKRKIKFDDFYSLREEGHFNDEGAAQHEWFELQPEFLIHKS